MSDTHVEPQSPKKPPVTARKAGKTKADAASKAFGPPAFMQIDAQIPSAPEIRGLAADLQARTRLAFAMAAAGHSPAGAKGADDLFARILARQPAGARQRMRQKAQAMLSAPRAKRESDFGRYAAIEPARYTGLAQAHATVGPATVDGKKLKAALEAVGVTHLAHLKVEAAKIEARRTFEPTRDHHFEKAKDPATVTQMSEAARDALAGARYKHLALYLNKVHCVVVTSGPGSDEIAMGGVATSPTGETTKIEQFLVSGDFDDHETKHYSGVGKLLHRFDIPTSHDWPHVYNAVMVMAERDEGGFGDFLQKLWDYVEDEVKSAVAGAVGAAIGTALGSFFGPLGAAIGALAGALLGWLVGWIISWFEDDLIAAHTITLYLGAATKSYYDWAGLTAQPAPQFEIGYLGDGSHYQAWFSLAAEE